MSYLISKNMIYCADWGRERHDVSPLMKLCATSVPTTATAAQQQQQPASNHAQSLPSSPRGHGRPLVPMPLQTRVALKIPPSTPVLPPSPVLPMSPRSFQAKRVPHPPPPLIPRPLMSAAQVRSAATALVDAHPPRQVTAILAKAPPPAPELPLQSQHPSTFMPMPPSPRPGSRRLLAAREVPSAVLEQMMQAHYAHAKPPGTPAASSTSTGAARPPSPKLLAARPPSPAGRMAAPVPPAEEGVAAAAAPPAPPAPSLPHVTESQEEAWGHFQMHVWRRLAGTAEEPPPPPPKKKPARKKRRKKRAEAEEEEEGVAGEDESWAFRITRTLQQMAAKSHMKMMDVFKKYDSDGSGAIDQFEFEAALVELGMLDVPSYEARKVFEAYDADSSGSLDMDELAKMIRSGRGPSQLDAKLQVGAVKGYMPGDHKPRFSRADTQKMDECLARLKAIDTDGDGTADLKEILAFLLAEGYDASAAEELMRTLDADGDGELSVDEWKAGVKKLSETLESAAGASALLALTEPVEPPSMDVFHDALVPTVVGPDGKPPYRSSRRPAAPVDPPSGCTIPDQTMRGIQLQQLRSMITHLKRRCRVEGWVTIDDDINQELGFAPGSSSPLEWDKCSMYDLLAYVIKPATRPRRCSFVELVASEPQPPLWYVAHRWGEPLVDTLACLEQHAKDRNLDLNTTTYWVCAFAISPWDLSEHLTADPFSSPFYRTLEAVTGIVVVVDRDRSARVGDPNAPFKGALAFNRLWVCFEVAVALQMGTERGFLFDLYTAFRHHITGDLIHPPLGLDDPPIFIVNKSGESGEKRLAVGLTDPTAPLERPGCSGEHKVYEPVEATAYRQAFFPSNLLVAALSSKLQKAQATVDADRKRILNALVHLYTESQAKVAGAIKSGAWHLKRSASLVDCHRFGLGKTALEEEPPVEHEAYDVYNGLLQAKLAPAALQRALREGQATLDRVIKEVRTAPLTVLRVSLRDAKDTAQFEDALKCLPETLRILELELPDVLYKVKPKKRDNADASTWNNVKVFPDLSKLSLRQRQLPPNEAEKLEKLEKLLQPPEMVIGRLVGYAHEAALFRAERLDTVDLQGWPNLEEIPWNLFEMTTLRTLNVSNCKKLTKIGVQFPLIPSQLESLILDGCTALTELDEGIGIKLSNLTELGLANCTGLGKLPLWVNDLERNGAGVIRPVHLS